MARVVTDMNQLKPGDKVFMFTTDFPATVLETEATDYTVRVRDGNGINTHYLAVNRLLKASPFEIGKTYQDANNDKFTFVKDDAVGAWTNTSGTFRDYSYPVRPLREVVYGPELND